MDKNQQKKPKKQSENKPNKPKNKTNNKSDSSLKLTDCLYFLDGSCKKGDDCKYRHSASLQQGPRKTCFKWEKNECLDPNCSYLHLKKKNEEKKESKDKQEKEKEKLADCAFFLDGSCKKGDNCKYRHAPQAIHNEVCRGWLQGSCSKVSCNFRHPRNLPPASPLPITTTSIPKTPPTLSVPPSLSQPVSNSTHKLKIAYFWDIENCPIPKSRSAFDVVQQIRTLANEEAEECFACIGDTNKLAKKSQEELALANVTLNHVPQIKPGDADRQIAKELTRFASSHQTPNHTIVLISGDVDFIQQLSSLRNTSKYKVVLLHNAQARPELIKTASKPQNASNKKAVKPKTQNNNNNTPKAAKPKTENNNNNTPKDAKPKTDKKQPKAKKQEEDFQCLVCLKLFKTRQSLEQHQNQKDHFVCAWCFQSTDEPGPTFDSPESVAEHVSVYHDCECDMCGQSYHFKKEVLIFHKMVNSHYLCHLCMKSFHTGEALANHQRAKDHAPKADSDDDSSDFDDEDSEDSEEDFNSIPWQWGRPRMQVYEM